MKKFAYRFFLAILCYLASTFYFDGRFAPFTTVNGISTSMMTSNEAKIFLTEAFNRDFLRLKGKDNYEEKLYFSTMKLKTDSFNDISSLLPNKYFWILNIGKNYTLPVNVKYDENNIKVAVNSLECVSSKHVISNKGNHVEMSKKGDLVLYSSDNFNKVLGEKLSKKIINNFSNSNFKKEISLNDCYDTKKWLDIEISGIIDFNSDFKIKMGDGVEEIFTKQMLSKSFYEKNGKLYMNYLPYSFVEALAEKYNTNNNHLFKTIDGKLITLNKSEKDTYEGWNLDVSQTVSMIVNSLIKKEKECNAVWVSKGVSHNKNFGFGDTYIEINLNKQKLYFVEKGKMVQNYDIISGYPDEKRKTPKGMFKIMDIFLNYNMSGYYGSAFCEYFIRLTPDGIGIHDASWQKEFGKDIYKTKGSHGCINMKYDDIKKLYNTINTMSDIPVIIY